MRQPKPTIFVDTNIPSVLCYRGSNVSTIHQQMVTREWWDMERRWFRIYGSVFTEGELGQGSYSGQVQALKLVRRLPYLPFIAAVRTCAAVYLDEHIIPKQRPGDAVQLAFATVHEIDYLLTWNYAHLANLDTQRKLKNLNDRQGRRTPFLVSPETIPRVALGQVIRRKKHEDEG
jgi:predicted nucleic acid-binding protein